MSGKADRNSVAGDARLFGHAVMDNDNRGSSIDGERPISPVVHSVVAAHDQIRAKPRDQLQIGRYGPGPDTDSPDIAPGISNQVHPGLPELCCQRSYMLSEFACTDPLDFVYAGVVV